MFFAALLPSLPGHLRILIEPEMLVLFEKAPHVNSQIWIENHSLKSLSRMTSGCISECCVPRDHLSHPNCTSVSFSGMIHSFATAHLAYLCFGSYGISFFFTLISPDLLILTQSGLLLHSLTRVFFFEVPSFLA